MSFYFDYAATTPVCDRAIEASLATMREDFGNPSSRYSLGQSATTALFSHRGIVATCLGCTPKEVVFTSGGTEGNNWAIFSGTQLAEPIGKHLITTAVEHAAVLQPIKALEQKGWSVTYLKPDPTGHISPEAFSAALRPDTSFVSMMLVNNETGALFPVPQCASLLKTHNPRALFHCDGVQGFLKVDCNVKTLGVDFFTLSGHKIYAPKGVGALYIKEGLSLPPLIFGGGQEDGRRSGTEGTPQIAALAAACQDWQPDYPQKLAHIKSYALDALATLPQVVLVSKGDAPHIAAISLKGYPSEMVVRDLSDRGIYLSAGSACHRGKPSHVFATLGLPKPVLMGMLRLSFSPHTTHNDVDTLVASLKDIAATRIAMG